MINRPRTFKKYIAALKKGDQKAFEKIYDEFWESLFAVGYNRIQKREIVEDILQEIFCELWKKRANLNITGSLHSYLHTALKYKVIDYYRSARFHKESFGFSMEGLRTANTTENVLSFNELYQKLQDGIESLPARCKLVFRLSENGLKSSEEIAEKLGISIRTVETQLYKSRKMLKEHLSDYVAVIGFFLLSL